MSDSPIVDLRRLAELVDGLDWYRRCLEDVVDRRPVRGLDEAKRGYDVAYAELKQITEAG